MDSKLIFTERHPWRLVFLGLLAILLVFSALACNTQPPITTGKVVAKQDIPARTWIQTIPITSCSGKPLTCHTTYIYTTHHDPEYWQLQVEDCSKAQCRTDWVTVSQADYNRHIVGDYWDAPNSTPQ
jgi:hypothetical protein